MRFQSYFNAPVEAMADVCDMTKDIIINCVGAVDDSINLENTGSRNDYYIMYVINGCMDIKFGEHKQKIHEGNLLIMSPGTHYSYSAEKKDKINYLWLHFTGNQAEQKLRNFDIPVNKILSCGYIGGIEECWTRMCNEFIINDEYFEQMSNSIFTEILTIFSRRLNKHNEKKRLLKSSSYIHSNYHKKLTIDFLASLEGLSESHYRAVFTRTFGESPVEYINSRRIEYAIYMLENTDKTLSEIAEFVGFNDVYYFGRLFKRKMGVSPGQYRKYRLKY